MIKAVIFDIGNVILAFDNDIFLNKISQHTSKSVDDLKEIIYTSNLANRYETGLLSSDDFISQVIKEGGLEISVDEFIEAYTQIYTPIETTIDLIKSLKGKYKLGILSNCGAVQIEKAISDMDFFGLFDTYTLSYKVGVMKPDIRIYEDASRKLGLKPEECIYIDDVIEYIDAANELGFHAIHYTNHEAVMSFLESKGILG